MSQVGVYEFLMAHKNKWFTNKQIAEAMGASVASVTCNTSKLIKGSFLDSKTEKLNKYRRTMYKAR